MKRLFSLFFTLIFVLTAYLLFWPVPVDPAAWQAPEDLGYTGPFSANNKLAGLEYVNIGSGTGPEGVAVDAQGRIYTGTAQGWIVRLDKDGKNPQNWVNTAGRPLGMAFSPDGNLIVADAIEGLLSIGPDGQAAVLASRAQGVPIAYADDLDVARDGKIYFTDASVKFNPSTVGNSVDASMLDLVEHGGNGRLLMYDPNTKRASVLVDGLQFANGAAVSHDGMSVLFNETGAYRVMRYWLEGRLKGQVTPVLENLPGFPDNITRGMDGRYWVALVAPRNALLDKLSDQPFARKIIVRLPKFIRPKAEHYGHIFAINDQGKVLADLQDPAGVFPANTSALETQTHILLGSLEAPHMARLDKGRIPEFREEGRSIVPQK
ncbi:Strictosidine synthase [Desulfatibacillum alkenivorans DSM 16219]|jgi:sugar lactone lactonase YvrE|uniref:Strictosidine synthase n=1 Tax=Desulfatibacillum alkenivorans DSM 16219 TaxID=1121393 RepID=A0A1M6KFD4_9BACT|nr:SMP-30/gluconolactonase/LRE family protein [Desulfatibacillum alkenivorans]SHJ57701.1 Strictosidine synthase [Desulfatibacillum alkenivorans DSM 16219]